GAREHVIAWKLRSSPRLDSLVTMPGNPGTAECGTNIAGGDNEAVVRACREHRIDLAVVGGEEPLAAGLVDRLAVEGIAAFGPTAAAAAIESSKIFAKELMARHGIPTAPFAVFDDAAAAADYVRAQKGPLVIKADGLAKGKGVIVTETEEEALAALKTVMVERQFGEAGVRALVEQRLFGPETSAQAFTDGRTVAHMPFSCDHKPIFDGNRGPNTGGMGAYSPPGWLPDETQEAIRTGVTEAAVLAMQAEGRPYQGVLYPGIMQTGNGPHVIEFNCRFGDPEAQVLLPRLESDLLEVMLAVVEQRLDSIELRWSDDACVGVVLASGGYPGGYETGYPITGLADLDAGVQVFQAGTRRQEDGTLVTAGGRVLTVTASGATMQEAREKAYRNVERIDFEGMHYRRDIGVVEGAGENDANVALDDAGESDAREGASG
ncbi:MAG: phosphoribosylamine--glycine ligase, partial [Chloroflexi bacterium]|nr:phosphoribosylamine--glycine ligase [Chloroflexota bacterium]